MFIWFIFYWGLSEFSDQIREDLAFDWGTWHVFNVKSTQDCAPLCYPPSVIPPQLVIPLQQVPLEALVAAKEEIASSRLSSEEEIDQFRFMEDIRPSKKPVDISDSKTDSIDISSVHLRQLIITQIDLESEEEEE